MFERRTWTARLARALLFLAMAGVAAPSLVTPDEAVAQRRRKAPPKRGGKRGEKKDAELGKKTETKLDAGLTEKLKRQKVEEAERGTSPEIGFETFRRTIEVQVAEKRRERITTLKKIIDLGPSEAEAPQLLFQLSELYWEEAKYYEFQANAVDDKIIAVGDDKRQVNLLKAEKAELLNKSKEIRDQAVAQYKKIVSQYKKYERMDEVLFSLGSNLWEQKNQKGALKVYKVLVTRYKESQYVPDAFLAFGEYYFDEGKVRKALTAYSKAAEFTESKIYGYALYKQGWCYYNLGLYDKAMEQFRAVVFYGETQTALGENKLALVKEARRDFVLAYSHVGDPKSARSEFQMVGGGDNTPTMLKGLAGVYYNTGKDKSAIYIYRDLIKEQPIAPTSPTYQARIVDASQRLGSKKFTVKQVKLLTRVFQEVEKAGVLKEDKEKKDFEEAKEFAERTLRTLAVSWHTEAKKTRNDDTYQAAKDIYANYVQLFVGNKFEYDIRFYYAELLYHLEEYNEAAIQYYKTLDIDIERIEGKRMDEEGKPEKPGRFRVEAAFNSILSFEEVARAFEETEERPDVEPSQQIDIPPAKAALLEACERYLKYVPNGDKYVEVRYKAANIYYRYNRFDDATERFSEIALKYPEHELAEYSANLILDSYNLLDKPDKVNEWARKFYANKKLAQGEYREELYKVIEQSALTMVERIAKEGKNEEAAKAFEGFVQEFPKSKKADKALYNASVSWANAKKLDRALEIRARIIREYPESDLVSQAIFTTARGYESVADFALAAKFYEIYADKYEEQLKGGGAAKPAPKKSRGKRGRGKSKPAAKDDSKKSSKGKYEESKAQEALFNAGVLREGLGQYGQARKDRFKYIELWPGAKDAPDLFKSIADLYEQEGKIWEMVKQLQDYLEKYKADDIDAQLNLRLRMAEALEKAGGRDRNMKKAADQLYNKISDMYDKERKKDRIKDGLHAVAVAKYRAVGDPGRAYRGAEIVYPWKEGKPAKFYFDFVENLQRLAEGTPEEQATITPRMIANFKKYLANLKRGIEVANKDFQNSLRTKSELLKAAVKPYTEIVQFKQAGPALCALEDIGRLYLDYIEALKTAPPPPFARNDDEVSMFRMQLEEQSFPITDSAVEAFSSAVNKSRELQLYNDCAARSLVELQKLRPAEWPKIVEDRVAGDQLPERSLGGDFLLAIQEIPEGFSEEGQLPADVASLAPPKNLKRPEPEPGADAGDGLPPPGAPDEPREPDDDAEPDEGKSLEEIYSEPDDEDLLP